MDSLQQPSWSKGSILPSKGSGIIGFTQKVRLSLFKHSRPCCISESLVTGTPPSSGNKSSFKDYGLSEADPEVHALIDKEKQRKFKGLELIASEILHPVQLWRQLVLASQTSILKDYLVLGIMEAMSALTNLCEERALAAFHLDGKKWGVNVQPRSGSPANFEVYTAILKPHDQIMVVDGARVERILDLASITLNKNTVPGDKNALVPSDFRIPLRLQGVSKRKNSWQLQTLFMKWCR